MSILIKLEKLDRNLIEETEAIIDENYAETSQFHQPLDINWNMYMMIDDAFKAFVMRDDDRIVGILFFAVDQYPHIQTWLMAQQLTFYVTPNYRRYSLQMIKLSEDYFRDLGVDVVIQSARYDSSFCTVLDKKGYEKQDITYTKRLN